MTGNLLSGPRLLLMLIWVIPGPVQADNYLDYYKNVALAEHDAVNGHYAEAIQKFDAAFRQYPYNNPIDCYVAAQLASYTHDTTSCIAFLRSGLSFGLPIQTIRRNPRLAPMVSNSGGILSRQNIDSCWRIYQQRFDHEARMKTISLIHRDQAVVQSLSANESLYERDGCTLKATYRSLWDSLLQEVILLTSASGFPAQKTIGTMNGDDSLFKVGPNSVYVYYILIHHGNAWPQMGAMLWEELQKGNITPQMYGAIHDNSNNNRSGSNNQQYFSVRPCETKASRKFVKEHLDEVNENRQRIGLCSYETMEEKFVFTSAYLKWAGGNQVLQQPVFDFQPELHFMATTQH